ncbi:hypothetical protein Vadar_008107 [Vaccinium darrowii]|uniref:Uncharacterized protein n=1 Tax=Vaccinium darrowii TaxID=229202 RepID=A0ACB7YDQ5_9ERIC|nr:hypothetical protein Vadar_008107 [Vaccinium darrowii]
MFEISGQELGHVEDISGSVAPATSGGAGNYKDSAGNYKDSYLSLSLSEAGFLGFCKSSWLLTVVAKTNLTSLTALTSPVQKPTRRRRRPRTSTATATATKSNIIPRHLLLVRQGTRPVCRGGARPSTGWKVSFDKVSCEALHKHNLLDVRGPITIVAGKQRQLQFVECPNDINRMIDAAKFADLALLLVDGSYGFEMETFEFLNILQTHGFPKIMGVLAHLDKFKDVKKLKKTKQRLKHRFWTEIYDGAKLFYLSGLIHGKYPKRKKGTKVHIAGVGDYNLAGITSLADPCPLPSAAKKKGLRDKEKLFYAPMSGLGDLLYDKDAVYININDHFVQFSKADDENGVAHKGKDRDVGEVLVKSLQNTKYSLDEKLENSFISLFAKKINLLSEAPSELEDAHKSMDRIKDIEPAELNQSGEPETDDSDEESDAEELDGSETSDKDKTYQEDPKMTTMDNESDE